MFKMFLAVSLVLMAPWMQAETVPVPDAATQARIVLAELPQGQVSTRSIAGRKHKMHWTLKVGIILTGAVIVGIAGADIWFYKTYGYLPGSVW